MEDALDKQLEAELEALNLSTGRPPKHSTVNTHRNSPLLFEGQKLIGGFQITKTQEYAKHMNVPKLIPLNSMKELEGKFLGSEFNTAIQISDYQIYHEQKQEFFFKWMIEENYHKGVIEKKYKKPTYICFSGRIADSMVTPAINKSGDWKIYAAKFNDAIYLWDEKEDPKVNRIYDLPSFFGFRFEHLLTHSDPKASTMNEFEKIFAINEITFGSHQLLCLSELDAETENKEWAEIKVYNQCSMKSQNGKFLKYWAQNIVPGIHSLVIGSHDSGFLKKVEVISTNELAKKNRLRTNECYEFEDRLLKFIQNQFPINDPKMVKTFSWKYGDLVVKVEDVPEECIPKIMLPGWYVEAVISQTEIKADTTYNSEQDEKTASLDKF